jgi:ADP-ribose pyrophosphatase YjhB (NUDIX family)
MDIISYYKNADGEEVKKSDSFKVLILVGNKLLLIHNELTPDRLTMPGGRAHVGETLQQTLEREFFEETGVHAALHVGALVHKQRHVFRSPVTEVLCDMTNHYYACAPADNAAVRGLHFYDLDVAESAVSYVHEKGAVRALRDSLSM